MRNTIFLLVSFFSTQWLCAETKHRFLTADSSKQRIAIIDEAGKIEW